MKKICLYCQQEFEAVSERVMFHDLTCFSKYHQEQLPSIYEQTAVKYNALSGGGPKKFCCLHYDTCLDGVIVRIEKEGRVKNNYHKTLKKMANLALSPRLS